MKKAKDIFNDCIQIGLIVENLDISLSNLERLLGMENFRIATYPPNDEKNVKMEYMGKEGNFKAKFCFFNYGNIEFEVIQPLGGDNIWADFLKKNNGPGLHHIKFLVQDHEEVKTHFDANGIKMIQGGASVGVNKGKNWKFYDTSKELGFFIEVMNVIK